MKRTILLVAISMAAWHVQAQGTCATAVTAVLGDYYVSQINGPEAPTPVCSSGGGGATPTVTTPGLWRGRITASNGQFDDQIVVGTGI